MFPLLSVTELTVAVVSFQPTATTLRLPAVWAWVYFTKTLVWGVCGTAEFTCTKAILAANAVKGKKKHDKTTDAQNTRALEQTRIAETFDFMKNPIPLAFSRTSSTEWTREGVKKYYNRRKAPSCKFNVFFPF